MLEMRDFRSLKEFLEDDDGQSDGQWWFPEFLALVLLAGDFSAHVALSNSERFVTIKYYV